METVNPSMTSTSTTLNMSLHLSRSPMDRTTKVPPFPLRLFANNPTTRAAFNHSIVDDLARSLSAMSTLEVLKTCPSQHKYFLFVLGVVDASDSRLITFDLDQ